MVLEAMVLVAMVVVPKIVTLLVKVNACVRSSHACDILPLVAATMQCHVLHVAVGVVVAKAFGITKGAPVVDEAVLKPTCALLASHTSPKLAKVEVAAPWFRPASM